jgi:Fe-S oxidoreductase
MSRALATSGQNQFWPGRQSSPSTTRAISDATPARSTSRARCSTRFGADIKEPERNRENPFCCGAGGGLLFADKEEEPGSRISDVRFKQLQATGANTVVTACPFCSIMLKGAQASAQADTQFVDLMTFVNGKLTKPS